MTDILIKSFDHFATKTFIEIYKRENQYYFILARLNGTILFNSAKENVFYDTEDEAIQYAFSEFEESEWI